MKKYFTPFISIFFLSVFLFHGIASLLPFISLQKAKQDIELLATEMENSGKEKEEKVAEKEWINHGMDLQLPGLMTAVIKKNHADYNASCTNTFLKVITPPPEIG